MPDKPKLVLDNNCEISDLLRPWAVGDFYNFAEIEHIKDHVYVVGRLQFAEHSALIRKLVNQGICVVFSNPFEGSLTLKSQIERAHMQDLVEQGLVPVISGGDIEPTWRYMLYDLFLTKIYDFDENHRASQRITEVYSNTDKPYKFLFLNGRTRPHRKYLVERFRLSGLLDQTLWSWLDRTTGYSKHVSLMHNGQDLIGADNTVQYLPAQYEVDLYRNGINNSDESAFVKYSLFDNEWGEIYLNADAYIDTYFSVVTETVFEYPYSFRTEKIWKPIAMGQPWIAVANQGYYRDMHKLGFRTFGHVIDESFDSIADNQQRIERIACVVEDLCGQDLNAFQAECRSVCEYNQQHLKEISQTTRNQFADRFFNFITQ